MTWRRVLLFSVAIVMIGAAWLLGSESGLRYVVNTALRFVPFEVTVGTIQGRLWNSVTLHNLSVTTPAAAVEIDKLALRWRLPRLLGGAVEVHSLDLSTVFITPGARTTASPAPDEAPPPTPITLPDVALPLAISVDSFSATDIQVNLEQPLRIARIDGAARFTDAGIDVDFLSAALVQGGFRLHGRLAPRGDYPLTLVGQWHWRDDSVGALAGGLDVSGSLRDLRISQNLHAPAQLQLTARAQDVFDALTWEAQLDLAATDPSRLRPDLPAGRVRFSIQANGTKTELQAMAAVDAAFGIYKTRSRFDLGYAANRIAVKSWNTRLEPGRASIGGRGDIVLAGRDTRADLRGDWQNLAWPLTGEAMVTSAAGQWQIHGTLNQYKAQFETALQTHGPVTRTINVATAVTGDPSRVVIESLSANSDADRLDATGWVAFAPALEFSIDASWPHLAHASPELAAPVIVQRGSLRASGGAEHYTVALQTDFAGGGFTPGTVNIKGGGDMESFRFEQLNLKILGGSVAGAGQVHWQPSLRWTASLDAKDIDPGQQWPDVPGAVDFHLDSDGALTETLSAHARLTRLDGTLRGQPLSGFADVRFADKGVDISPAHLRYGSGQVVAQGRLLDRWSLSWNAEFPRLEELGLGLTGQVTSAGNFSVNEAGPQVAMNMDGEGIGYEKNHVKSIHLDARTQLDERLLSYVTLNAEDINFGGTAVNQVRVTGHGTLRQHFLVTYVEQPMVNFALHAIGGYADQRWQGRLASSMFTLGQGGQWNQKDSPPLAIARDRFEIGNTCWTHNSGELCLKGNWDATQPWTVTAQSDTLPLNLLLPWLPDNAATDGVFKLDGSIRGQGGAIHDADVVLGSPQGTVDFVINETDTVRTHYTAAQMFARWKQDGITLGAGVKLNDNDRVRADVHIAAAAGQPLDSAPLQGELDFSFGSLGILPAIIPAIDQTQGELSGRFTFAGTPSAPVVGGSAQIDNGVISIAPAGITLRDIALNIESHDYAVTYGLRLRSGNGHLRTDGRFDFAPGEPWSNTVLITGDKFEVVNIPEYRVLISPELSVSGQAEKADVVGTVAIPLARIEPKGFSGAVTPSSDVVIVDDETASGKKMVITSVVRLSLGDQVDFQGFGLRAKFGGDVVVMDSPEQATSAHGEIRVVKGDYDVFGQKLAIDRGRLVFIGGVIDDPGLDIRASREIKGTEDILVGVNVRGTLRDPKLSVFSNPSMAESDVLSYIIAGQPMNAASGAEGDKVYSAANSAAFAGGALVAKKIGTALGFEEEQIELDSESVSVGRFISPKLFVSYGRDFVDQINKLKIRYTLSSRWALEAESGSDQGADLLYTIETD